MSSLIVTSTVTCSDAVAAIIQIESDGRYLLQKRDNIPNIWYPGHWGCFGGAIDTGESDTEALHRELYEELEYSGRNARYFTRLDFDLRELGLRQFHRTYFEMKMSRVELENVRLHEGEAVDLFPIEQILHELRVTPYDAYALFLHHARHRIRE